MSAIRDVNTIRTLIVDDEPLARQIVREFLEKDPEIQIVGECGDAHQALQAMEASRPQLIFLDIQMPEITGFEFLDMLEDIPHIVFCTAYDQFALKAFEVNAVDYLLKPLTPSRFQMALQRVKAKIKNHRSPVDTVNGLMNHLHDGSGFLERMLIKQSGKIVMVGADEIEWIEALEDYVNIHTAGHTYLVLQSLSRLEKRLDPARFLRVHRSNIIHIQAISEIVPISGGRFICRMKNGGEVAVSRAGAARLKPLTL